jgi:hypothetical protein
MKVFLECQYSSTGGGVFDECLLPHRAAAVQASSYSLPNSNSTMMTTTTKPSNPLGA